MGETVCDPFTVTAAPFKVALTALVDVQVRVELPPAAIEVGLALIPAVGALEVTVTRTCPQSVAPAELRAVIRYVVETVGDTVCDPFNGTVVPFRSALTAFLVVHVSVELPPDAMTVGFALMPAAGVCARTGKENIPISRQINQQALSSIQTYSFDHVTTLRLFEPLKPNF